MKAILWSQKNYTIEKILNGSYEKGTKIHYKPGKRFKFFSTDFLDTLIRYNIQTSQISVHTKS